MGSDYPQAGKYPKKGIRDIQLVGKDLHGAYADFFGGSAAFGIQGQHAVNFPILPV